MGSFTVSGFCDLPGLLAAELCELKQGERTRIGLQENKQSFQQTICGILRTWYILSSVRCGELGLNTTTGGKRVSKLS